MFSKKQVEKIIEVTAGKDYYRSITGTMIMTVLELFPDCPVEVLKKITIETSKATDGSHLQSNAGFVIAAWLKTLEKID